MGEAEASLEALNAQATSSPVLRAATARRAA